MSVLLLSELSVLLLRLVPSTAGTVSVRIDSAAQRGQGAGQSNSAMRLTAANGPH
jgi:hypothetical protein